MTRNATVTAFTRVVTDALEHVSDSVWLGSRSLLAAPYMLGELLPASRQSSDALGRGCALQNLLQKCIQQLGEQEGTYYQNLLEIRYWQGRLSEKEILAELGISRSKYFRDRLTAIQSFERILLDRLKPSLRSEFPIVSGKPIGRERQQLIDACSASFRSKQTIALTGPGGLGKSFLGAYLFGHLKRSRAVFWYTFRPHLNDHLHDLLFMLGHFLFQHQVPAPWLQMVADLKEDGTYMLQQATLTAIFRHALGQFDEQPPLLFFDEVDLLAPDSIEDHALIVAFLESLRHITPVLLMGQQVRLEADHYFEVPALTVGDIAEVFEQRQVGYHSVDLNELYDHTGGNPRLVELIITLHDDPQGMHRNIQLNQLFEELSGQLSVEVLLRRILQRLDQTDIALLQQLSVFRRSVPADSWQNGEQLGVLSRLVERRLLQLDGAGGISILPTYREVLYKLQTTKQRELLHRYAAAVRGSHGEFTAAAYHLVQAGEPVLAIALWRNHQTDEVNQGQSHAALDVFRRISDRHLTEPVRMALALIMGELARMAGIYEEAREYLQDVERWGDPILQMEAYDLLGDIAELYSEFGQAQEMHRNAINVAERLASSRLAISHKNLGFVFKRERLLKEAQREADLASFEAESFQGLLKIDAGNLEEAKEQLTKALTLALQQNHVSGEAKIYVYLNRISNIQGDFEWAIQYIKKAVACYEALGILDAQAGCKVNWAVLHNLAEQPAQAIPLAREALDIFKQLDSSFGRSLAFQALAESFLLQNDLIEAEQFARQAIQEEEPHVFPDGLRVLGEIRIKQRAFDEADSFIQDSIHHAVENEDPFLEAYGWRARMVLLSHQGKDSEAKAAYEKAIALFSEMGLAYEEGKTTKLLDELTV